MEIAENPFKGRMPNEAELKSVIGEADAILVGNDRVSRDVLAQAKRLKVVSKSGIGVDNIDVDACAQLGIAVTNVPGTTAVSVAELTIALMLNISKLVMFTNRRVMSGMWPVDRGHDIFGKKLGIVGFGRIGRQVAVRAKAFGMDIMAYDPYMDHKAAEELGVRPATLDEITQACQYITLHVPMTPENANLFGAERISRMLKGSYLINAARGGLVDEDALYDALMSGHLAGAAADVLKSEPPAERPKLFDCENFLITSHSGGNSQESVSETSRIAAENIIAVLEGLPCPNVVNAKALAYQLGKIGPYRRAGTPQGRACLGRAD